MVLFTMMREIGLNNLLRKVKPLAANDAKRILLFDEYILGIISPKSKMRKVRNTD